MCREERFFGAKNLSIRILQKSSSARHVIFHHANEWKVHVLAHVLCGIRSAVDQCEVFLCSARESSARRKLFHLFARMTQHTQQSSLLVGLTADSAHSTQHKALLHCLQFRSYRGISIAAAALRNDDSFFPLCELPRP